MYNEEYDNEQESKTNDNFFVNFYYNNKILIWILIGVVAFILIMSLLTKGGSSDSSGKGYNITITPNTDVVISMGNSVTLKAKVNNNASAIVTWSSENENIAKVSDGTVTAVGYGKTKIMATYIHGQDEKYTASKEITVADGNAKLQLTDVSFKDGSLLMPLNSTYKISLVLSPSNGYVTNKVFTSSKENVVTVDNTGLVTSVGEGEATISLNVNDGAFKRELRVFVSSVYTKSEIIVSPEKIDFDGELKKIKLGSREKLKYTLFPTNSNSDKLIWTSSDPSVATVDQNGIVQALKAGRTVVTLKSVTGVSDSIDIEVEENIVEVTDISLNLNSLYLNVNQNETITPVVSPSNASNKALSFVSGDTSIIAVAPNQTGTSAVVYALSVGNTTLTISANNNVEKRISVTVAAGSSGGNNNGGGSNGGGGSTANQGFTISSHDANWEQTHEGFIVSSYGATNNNAATAPVEITVTKTDSSIAKLRVAECLYPASSCDPSSSGSNVHEITDSGSFTMRTKGTWVLRVGKYNSKGTQIGTVDKYIAIGNTSSGGGGSSSGTEACYCNTNGYCTWATAPTTYFTTKNTAYNTKAKCDEHTAVNCCYKDGTTYKKGLTVQSKCVDDSCCSSTGCNNSSGKTTPIINLDPNSLVLKDNTGTVSFKAKVNALGNLTFKSNDTSCVTVPSLRTVTSANQELTINVQGKGKSCSATITVGFTPSDSSKYNSATSKTVQVVVGSSKKHIMTATAIFDKKTGNLTLRDGTTTLTSSSYACTRTVSDTSSVTKYSFKCTGKGNYTGSNEWTFTITK